MTREELLQAINLGEDLIPAGKENRPGTIITPLKITIHNTSNTAVGANAKAHSRFVRETGHYLIKDEAGNEKKNWVSWHFTVDDNLAIKQLPSDEKGFHAGTATGNLSSLGIEICMHSGIDQIKANVRAARLAALLCFDLNIPVEGVVTHKFWSGKNCPELLLPSWDSFIEEIRKYYNALKGIAIVASVSPSAALFSGNSVAVMEGEAQEAAEKPVMASKEKYRPVQNSFNTGFLEAGPVILPVVSPDHPGLDDHVFLHHQNLTIYFNISRRLALYTGCNFDKNNLKDIPARSNAFCTDPHIDTSFQLEHGFYQSETLRFDVNSIAFDRGHIIARRYNQWGEDTQEAMRGERDTYYFTTIYPQVKELNQGEWEHLESFVIDQSKLDVKRLSIIAGTFLKPNDPVATYKDKFYRNKKNVQIPTLFWKIIYYEVCNELRKISFLMSQVNRLKQLSFVDFGERLVEIAGKEEDPFDKINASLKTYIVHSSLIEEYTGLRFSDAKELYETKEPLEVVIKDNETSSAPMSIKDIRQFI